MNAEPAEEVTDLKASRTAPYNNDLIAAWWEWPLAGIHLSASEARFGAS